MDDIPVIDVSALTDGSDPQSVAQEIGKACRNRGFFYITGHGVSNDLLDRLEQCQSRIFCSWHRSKNEDPYGAGWASMARIFPSR